MAGKTRSLPFDRFMTALFEPYRGSGYPTRYAISRTLGILKEMGVETAAELERDDIEDRFSAECQRRGWCDGTLDEWKGRLRSVVRKGVKMGLLLREPKLSVTRDFRKEPRTTSPPPLAEMVRLFSHAAGRRETWDGDRLYALLATLVGTGIPLITALKLEPSDFSAESGSLKIWVARGKRFEEKRIARRVAGVLEAWTPRAKEYLFPRTPDGGLWHTSGRINGTGPHPSLLRTCRAAGVAPPLRFDRIRAYYLHDPMNAADVIAVQQVPPTKRCVVQLTEPGGPVRVYGRLKAGLTPDRFNVIRVLIEAGPDGLSKPQLDAMAKATGPIRASWRQILIKMRAGDGDWEKAIVMAGGPYGRYKIEWASL